MPPYSRLERAGLTRELERVGPSAPTLCGGWSAADLAAHLVAREYRPDSAPGILLPPLAGWTERVRRGLLTTPYEDLVEAVRSGPPLWSPMGLPGLESLVNTVEYFIHHEDVRRAQPGWSARASSEGLEKTLWSRLQTGARMFLRSATVPLELTAPGFGTIRLRHGRQTTETVTLTGPPSELLLYATGRTTVAQVKLGGGDEALALFETWPASGVL
jgi:uncharacterized protein (TIGR03085 family)